MVNLAQRDFLAGKASLEEMVPLEILGKLECLVYVDLWVSLVLRVVQADQE